MKNIIGFSNFDEVPPVNCDGEIIYDWELKCNKFNDYFSNICNMDTCLK